VLSVTPFDPRIGHQPANDTRDGLAVSVWTNESPGFTGGPRAVRTGIAPPPRLFNATGWSARTPVSGGFGGQRLAGKRDRGVQRVTQTTAILGRAHSAAPRPVTRAE